MKDEIWKDVVGYEGYYMVSDLGRVKSLSNRTCNGKVIPREKILKGGSNNRGYQIVSLVVNGVILSRTIHRLVMIAFVGESNLQQIDHINEDKTDNRLCNLRYCSNRDNMRYYTMSRPKTSKYFGVKYDKKVGRWSARIKHNGIREYLGQFKCETAAHIAYERKLMSLSK